MIWEEAYPIIAQEISESVSDRINDVTHLKNALTTMADLTTIEDGSTEGYGREAEIIGTGGITVSHGAAGSKASQDTAQEKMSSLYPTVKSKIPESITPERKGQQIVVVDSPQQPQPQVISPKISKPQETRDNQFLSEINMLNRFIKQKILLDLSFL